MCICVQVLCCDIGWRGREGGREGGREDRGFLEMLA